MVYRIREFRLLDDFIVVYTKCPDLMKSSNGRDYVNSAGDVQIESRLFIYTESLSLYDKPNVKLVENTGQRFLPYKATVIECIPAYYNFDPKEYENCSLMVEKHGGYLQFYSEKEDKVLRIAINSHFYRSTNEQ